MTVALHDAVLLTDYLRPSVELRDLHDWAVIADRLQEWYWKRKHLAGVVNILSIALYDLFGADGELLLVQKRAMADWPGGRSKPIGTPGRLFRLL